tara:strand:+ start:8467 stop:9363 length:897 start_codon:yes stop_codon:yes gene_type:complete
MSSNRELAERALEADDVESYVRFLKLAIKEEPRDADLLHELAHGLVSVGDKEEALRVVQQALYVEPNDGHLHLTQSNLLLDLNHVGRARRALESGEKILLESKDPEDLARLNHARAYYLIEGAYQSTWPLDSESGLRLPVSRKSVTTLEGAITKAKALKPSTPEIRTLIGKAEELVQRAQTRVFVGTRVVVVSAVAVGALLLLGSGAESHRPDAAGNALIGGIYVASGFLYLHAARAPAYRLGKLAGKEHAGNLFAAVVGGNDNGTQGLVGCLMALMCLGVFAPFVVVYHYVRNYLMK